MTSERADALRTALEHAPGSHPLRLLLIEALTEGRPGAEPGDTSEAITHYRFLLDAGALPRAHLVAAGSLALQAGDRVLAARCVEEAERQGVVEGVAALQTGLNDAFAAKGLLRLVPRAAMPEASHATHEERARGITFLDVGGLEEVKKVIHRMIVLPFKRPDLYEKYGRRAGGGVLLYGPPGCGKTMLARATAGECALPFFNVRIEDILDPYLGVSEKKLHDAFEQSRAKAPCVLFLDELDAIGFARRKQHGSAGRSLVDQLLQELDAIGSENERVLILAATNAPWDLDDALKRPGRFDRVVFVPPPDEPARKAILTRLLAELYTEKVDVAALARVTPLFSGADLAALVQQAVDRVIDDALDTGSEPPLTPRHFEAVRADLRPTTLEWLARVRNYVEFANKDDRYKDVAAFLRSKEARSNE